MQGLLHLPHEGLEASKLLEQRFMCKELDVLHVVEGLVHCTAFVYFLHILGFVGVDTFENAEPPVWDIGIHEQ